MILAGLLAVALVATVWLFLDHIKEINVSHELRVSELLTRIQHPEIVRPEIRPPAVEPKKREKNEMHLIGTIGGPDES